MEAGRTRWTDERIDDLALEVRSLRGQMCDGFRDLRDEMREGFREGRSDSALNRRLLFSMWVTTTLGFLGLIVEAGLR